MIERAGWEAASMDAKAVFAGSARACCSGGSELADLSMLCR